MEEEEEEEKEGRGEMQLYEKGEEEKGVKKGENK